MTERFSSQLKPKGQNVTEVSVILILLAALMIPFFVDLGHLINSLFGASSASVKAAPIKKLAVQPFKPGLEKYATTENLGKYQATYDPQTGQITYQLPEAMGGGSLTTSVDGATSTMCQELLSFINIWKGPNGETAPDDVTGMVKELARLGMAMSKQQAIVNKKNAGCKKANASGCASKWNLIYATQDYSEQFEAVIKRVATLDANYQEVKDVVNGYSGVISTVNYANYLQDSYKYASGINKEVYDLVEGYGHFGLAVKVASTREQAPVITYDSSQKIDRVADKAP